ncbi:hypothetical protein ACPCG0_11715 [Propionibacteriaceae bacterium Y1923]
MTDNQTPLVDEPVDAPAAAQEPAEEPDTFPREYVQQLRQEAADARVKAKKADDWARELFHARVSATGLLADPSDLPFDEALLDDHAAMEAAIDELIGRKPHLASRTPRGDVGQGATGATGEVSLADLLKAGAA